MNTNTLIFTAWISITLSVICLAIILIDVLKHPQRMKIMNVVWPVTALYAGPAAVWFYLTIGKRPAHENGQNAKQKSQVWQSVLKGALHCGSGCTLGDLIAALSIAFFSIKLFSSPLATDWILEYIAALVTGIVFQYYAIKPMKKLLPKDALIAALKADALSLTFWQIGMYGWMAIADFFIFHHLLNATEPAFWLMMQIGMLCGLATAFPINWWLIKSGIKEAM